MNSAFTNGEIVLQKEQDIFEYRKDSFEITFHFYKNTATGEQFTTTELDELNLVQLHNKYRKKYSIPFTNEIKEIRTSYGLSALKMSEVLGLGANVYRSYEAGEVPSVATGRLIKMSKDPGYFMQLLDMNKDVLDQKEYEKIKKKLS